VRLVDHLHLATAAALEDRRHESGGQLLLSLPIQLGDLSRTTAERDYLAGWAAYHAPRIKGQTDDGVAAGLLWPGRRRDASDGRAARDRTIRLGK
jgi:hypothetical protein